MFSDKPTAFSPPRAGELPEADILSLVVLSGPDAGQVFVLEDDEVLVGRATECDIMLSDPFISRHHVQFSRRPGRGRYQLEDQGSAFGTWVEGDKTNLSTIQDGDRIQISAATILRARYQDPRESALFARLQASAVQDPSTGLFNRGYLLERLEQEFSFSSRKQLPLSVLIVHLDDFRRTDSGTVLAETDHIMGFVSARLKRSIRREDVCARFGHAELVVLARGTDHPAAQQFGERLLMYLKEAQTQANDEQLDFTVHVGFSTLESGAAPPETAMDLLVRADAAMYASKQKGGWCSTAWKDVVGDERPTPQATKDLYDAAEPKPRVNDPNVSTVDLSPTDG